MSNFYGCKDYKFVGSDPTILTNNSDFESSEAPYRTDTVTIADGETITDSPYNGRSSDEAFPYYNFEYGDKGALIAVGWSSTWQTDFTYKDGVTTFSDKQKVFSSYIKPGEVARTPLTAMCFMTEEIRTVQPTFGETGLSTAICTATTVRILSIPL